MFTSLPLAALVLVTAVWVYLGYTTSYSGRMEISGSPNCGPIGSAG